MRKPSHLTKSFHIFSAAHRLLGDELLGELWKKSLRQIYRWGTDPAVSDDASRNPLDLVLLTLQRLQEMGRNDVVESALHILADPLGYEVTPKAIHSDKDSAMQEFCDVAESFSAASKELSASLADGTLDAEDRARLLMRVRAFVRQGQEMMEILERKEQPQEVPVQRMARVKC
ncbi:MAG: hypothetical protein ACRERD_31100 [Candidatus Binatia bacterium]